MAGSVHEAGTGIKGSMRELTALSMDTGGPVPRPAADSVGLEVGLDPCLFMPHGAPLGPQKTWPQAWVKARKAGPTGAGGRCRRNQAIK